MSIKLLGHRVHPMLVGFPLGLLGTSVVFDIVYLATSASRWAGISFWMIGAGVVSGLIAAPFGSLDWLAIANGTRAKRVGLYHGATAVASVILFATSWWLRYNARAEPDTIAIALSFVGVAFLAVAGWLGGELVERLGIGVDVGAHPNSPSSLMSANAAENDMRHRTDDDSTVDLARPVM